MRFQGHIQDVIESCGLRLHPTKTQKKVVGPYARHEALGVITNGGGQDVDVPRSYRRCLRSLLRLCRRYGPGILVRRDIAQDPRAFLRGKVAYAIQVNRRHQSLLNELDKLDWSLPPEGYRRAVDSLGDTR